MAKRILGIVGWVGTALVLGAVAVRFLRPGWAQYASWAAYAGLVAVLVYTLSQWREIASVFRQRQARLGTIAATSVVVVLAILVTINYIASRQNKRWDLTASGQFTLSDQTRRVVTSLDQPLRIVAFARETEFGRLRDRLGEYQYLSGRLTVDYIDPDKKPSLARQYQVQAYNTLVFEYQGRTERITTDSEQDITNAIIKVVTGQQKKVYFLQGHGEKDTANSERGGYSAIAAALGRDNFGLDKLVLAQQPDVPADASVVVVAGPRTDLFGPEIDALRRYLARGGKILFLLDPPEAADEAPLANTLALLREWGIEVGTNVVVDASGVGQLLGTGPEVPVVASYPSHPIVDRFNLITAYPLARSVTAIAGGTNGRLAQGFLETTARSWAEVDIARLMKTGEVEPEETKGDRRGPITIGAAVAVPATDAPVAEGGNGRKPEARVAAIGDSDFVSNGALGIQGNKDLFLNAVNWLAQQENLISIRPTEPEDRRVTITADQQRLVNWFSLLVIPGLIIGTGVYTWWRRR
jgi:ABC-type uncharacterized transport system involved in gliding motility auxiliary subunit